MKFINYYNPKPYEVRRSRYEGESWSNAETDKPITLIGYHGSGTYGGLDHVWQNKFGREFLLGQGFYVAPSENLASKFGATKSYRVTLRKPYVVSGATGTSLTKLDIDKIKNEGYDGIIIKKGRFGFGRGQEDLRQLVVFPGNDINIEELNEIPVPSTMRPNARVRVIKVVGPEDYVNNYRHGELEQVGKEGIITSLDGFGHPKVRIGKKIYKYMPDEIEVIGGEHRKAVEEAIREGLEVDEDILNDYPDIYRERKNPSSQYKVIGVGIMFIVLIKILSNR